jgi:hypothetical protein
VLHSKSTPLPSLPAPLRLSLPESTPLRSLVEINPVAVALRFFVVTLRFVALRFLEKRLELPFPVQA